MTIIHSPFPTNKVILLLVPNPDKQVYKSYSEITLNVLPGSEFEHPRSSE